MFYLDHVILHTCICIQSNRKNLLARVLFFKKINSLYNELIHSLIFDLKVNLFTAYKSINCTKQPSSSLHNTMNIF